MSSSVAEQAVSQETQEAADRDEKQLEAEGRDSTKSTQETSTDEGNASQQSSSKEGSNGLLPERENSTVAFPDELLKNAVATSEGVTEETLKVDMPAAHPSPVEAVPALRSAAEGDFTTVSERRVSTTDNKSRRHVVLGAGRFGKVVLGHHNRSGALVAVKIIDKSRMRGAGSEKDELNFRQEIEMHRRLPAHRNIVTVYDVYEDRKSMYLVMELCDRVSLLDKLAEEGPLHEDVARQIFLQILAAVKHCHDHHVVHRDLKPENVLFARRQQPADTGRQLFSVVDSRNKTAAGRDGTGLRGPGEQGSSYVDQAQNQRLSSYYRIRVPFRRVLAYKEQQAQSYGSEAVPLHLLLPKSLTARWKFVVVEIFRCQQYELKGCRLGCEKKLFIQLGGVFVRFTTIFLTVISLAVAIVLNCGSNCRCSARNQYRGIYMRALYDGAFLQFHLAPRKYGPTLQDSAHRIRVSVGYLLVLIYRIILLFRVRCSVHERVKQC
eukprot:XP_028343271.1 calcium-dependent protein kinase 2-like [Physeter catodon]